MLVLCVLAISSSLFAGSVDYLGNQSAKYMMTYSRNASTDASADIVNFNPAGAAYLPQGLYFSLSNQTLIKPYSQDIETDLTALGNGAGVADKDNDSSQDLPTYSLPNFNVAYSFGQMGSGKLAVFMAAGVIAGGGKLDWEDGTGGTTFALSSISVSCAGAGSDQGDIASQSFTAHSVYYGIGVGGAYSFFNDMISLSLGGRYVMGQRDFTLDATYAVGTELNGEYSYKAHGFTPIAGITVKPISGLNLAMRYEHETNLKFKYKEETFKTSGGTALQRGTLATVAGTVLSRAGIEDGKKFTYNLPQILGMGAEYQINNELTVMTAVNLYFLSLSDMGKVYDSGTGNKVCDLNDYFGTGYEVSLGATYMLMKKLKIGAGFLYTVSGAKKSYFENQYTMLNCSANPPLDSVGIGLGGTYSIENIGLDITLVGGWIHYLPLDYEFASEGAAAAAIAGASGTYAKDVYNIALGLGYKM
jgi:long-chain fatty acid transport protein